MATKNTPRPVYDLDSEVARLKRKFPEFELRLPGVKYSDQDRAQHREDWDSTDHAEGESFEELPEYELEPKTIKVPSLAFMDDDTALLSNTNPPEALRRHIGSEAYEDYVARGGTSGILIQIMQADQAAHTGE
jgi:hypothetical protein